MRQNECENCFYYKPREADPETGELAYRPWCLESEQPFKCESAVLKFETKRLNHGHINK